MPVIDLNQIFIAREAQLRSFNEYLEHWLQHRTGTTPHDKHEIPSPNNKIQGLVVLLYGHGGFGKTTLLKRYHKMISESSHHLKASSIIDWEFESDWSTAHFNSVANAELDPLEYTAKLCNKLAYALNMREDQFREYKQAFNSLDAFRNEVRNLAENILREKQYHSLHSTTDQYIAASRKITSYIDIHASTIEAATSTLSKLVWKGANIQPDLLLELYTRLQTIKGSQLYDYLNFANLLSIALGRDLSRFAKRRPILVFFDTYEKIDEGDIFLRTVMKSAGAHVGWVIAGRDNLWAGFEHTKRSTKMEYGYKDIVRPDHILPVDFDTSGAGAFSPEDIIKYFTELQQQQPSLLSIGQPEAERIWQVTQGVPLAVGITADFYARRSDLQIITESTESVLEIVDRMVRRYLLHVPDDIRERAKLYGLALIRRANNPQAVVAALDLKPGQENTYERELTQLHKHYSFVFTEKGLPFLHQEVRHFLRVWLLEHRLEPEEVTVIERLRKTYQARLDELEKRYLYKDVRSRLQDGQWTEAYIDQAEIQCWSDIKEGIGALLLFVIAASAHSHDAYYDALEAGTFFEDIMPPQYLNWWQLSTRSLLFSKNQEEKNGSRKDLEQLAKLIEQRAIVCSSPLSTYLEELLAIVWWKLGQTYRAEDEPRAIGWYQMALRYLNRDSDIQKDVLDMYRMIAYKLFVTGRHEESISILDDALELAPEDAELHFSLGNAYYALKHYQQAATRYHYAVLYNSNHVYACMNLGNTHYELKEYAKAIAEYNEALHLTPDSASIYYNRANVYDAQCNYQKALEDFDHTIALAPDLAYAYGNRGHVYAQLGDYPKAIADYDRAFVLKPTDINIAWTAVWASFGRTFPDKETIEKIEAIAALDPYSYTASLCRGIVAFIRYNDLKAALAKIQQAEDLEPEAWDPPFWKGMVYAYLGQTIAAKEAIKKALDYRLPPLFLLPLSWFEKDKPDFFAEYAAPLLKMYGL
jgi:tetratricopeptide (TPR) repeat protein